MIKIIFEIVFETFSRANFDYSSLEEKKNYPIMRERKEKRKAKIDSQLCCQEVILSDWIRTEFHVLVIHSCHMTRAGNTRGT